MVTHLTIHVEHSAILIYIIDRHLSFGLLVSFFCLFLHLGMYCSMFVVIMLGTFCGICDRIEIWISLFFMVLAIGLSGCCIGTIHIFSTIVVGHQLQPQNPK